MRMQKIKVSRELQEIAAIFSQHGFEVCLVGGAVRDALRKKNAYDWDLATNAKSQDVMKIFKRVIPTGIAHGTVTVLFRNHKIEVTTYRTESDYSDGRHPDSVCFLPSIEEDLSRRDFTMNAIAAFLPHGIIIDPFNGQLDIKNKIIRTVGNARDRFSEDGLRPVRAIRFAAKLKFNIEKNTLAAIPLSLTVTKQIAIERFADEFIKMLSAEQPSIALMLMEKTGILEHFFPELSLCRAVEQKGFHQFDVLTHLFLSCDAASAQNLSVRLAALFHDVGKPLVKKTDLRFDAHGNHVETITFYQHEIISTTLAEKILMRLHFSNQTIDYVCHLIKNHMFHYEANWTDAAVRRFLVRIQIRDYPHILDDLFDLRYADLFGMTGREACADHLLDFQNRIEQILQSEQALCLKDLAVNGKDLLQVGIPKGKQLGFILQKLLETVLESPESNTKQHLLLLAQNLAGLERL